MSLGWLFLMLILSPILIEWRAFPTMVSFEKFLPNPVFYLEILGPYPDFKCNTSLSMKSLVLALHRRCFHLTCLS
jgi:hypothetical protein